MFGRAQRTIRRLVRRKPTWIIAGLVLLHVALALLTFEPRPHTGGDNAAYITLARSLLERGAYVELWDPAEAPHTKYPPVFPLILATAMALGLTPWVHLKFVVIGLSGAAVAFSFLWLRARRQAALALAVGVILAVAPGVLREGRWILSDVPFWAFTMAALWAFERLRPDDWKRFGIAAAATLLAYFTRSAGLPLVVAALAWLGWRRHWRQFGVLTAVIGAPALWWWLRARAHATTGYVSEFWLIEPYQPALGTIGPGDLLARIAENIEKYVAVHLPALMTDGSGAVPLALGVIIFVFALAGWAPRLRCARVADLFLPAYIGLIFIWPAVWSAERFLLPALPLVLFYAGSGLACAGRRFVPRHTFAAGTVTTLIVLLFAVPGLVRATVVGRECTARYLAGDRYPCLGSIPWIDFFALAEVTGLALPDDAVVLNRKPRLYHVLSGGLKGRNYPLEDDADVFFAAADSAGARYVIFDRLDGISSFYLRPILVRHAPAFCVMQVSNRSGTALFGLMPRVDGAVANERGPDEAQTISFPLCDAGFWRSEDVMRIYGRP